MIVYNKHIQIGKNVLKQKGEKTQRSEKLKCLEPLVL